MDDATIQTRFRLMEERFKAIESQLAVLSQKAGVAYEAPDDGVSQQVRDLAATGRKIDAIKALRAESGMGLAEAKEVIEGL